MAVNSKYSPKAIINTPPEQRKHILARLWLPAVLLLALAAGGLTGIIAAYELNYSPAANEVAALATYRPSVVTRVYADDGETVIGEFALEKRIPLKYEEIPPVLKNAILAVEDVRFYDHIGIDPIRIMGAAWKNITTDKIEGGSTLTQQLTKNLVSIFRSQACEGVSGVGTDARFGVRKKLGDDRACSLRASAQCRRQSQQDDVALS